jgi:dTDP-4-dehydrorhamnose reductase
VKLLLFGKDGQVGWELQRALAPLGELLALGRADADFERPDELARIVRSLHPDAIVNAAAYTDVERAEREPERAQAVNAEAPGVLARETARLGAWLVHYGTDYVFDGSGSAPRDESAPTAPLSAYGRSKLDGERRIGASGCRHLILRAGWIHAPRGENFPLTVLRLAREREGLTIVDDQIGAPTSADLVADVTAHALRAARRAPALGGTYHVAAAGETSRFGVARFVIDWARARGIALRVTDLAPVGTAAADGAAARRPLNCRLDTTKLRRSFELALPPWQAGLERTLVEAVCAR